MSAYRDCHEGLRSYFDEIHIVTDGYNKVIDPGDILGISSNYCYGMVYDNGPSNVLSTNGPNFSRTTPLLSSSCILKSKISTHEGGILKLYKETTSCQSFVALYFC